MERLAKRGQRCEGRWVPVGRPQINFAASTSSINSPAMIAPRIPRVEALAYKPRTVGKIALGISICSIRSFSFAPFDSSS
jgi:hypothetical protein